MTTFKRFLSDDIATTRTLLHEAIPITGSIVNTTTYTSDQNIKTYGHGMFQSVYDYPYQSSSSNHIFDIAYGTHALVQNLTVANPQVVTNDFKQKRLNIYNQMAQVLVGHDVEGNIRKFDVDGDLTGGVTHDNMLFFNFSRLLGKDEIKKGTFEMKLGVKNDANFLLSTMHQDVVTVADTGAANDYRTNSPAGEYGILKISGTRVQAPAASASCGLIFYQAAVVALNPLVFDDGATGANFDGVESQGTTTPGFLTAPSCNMKTGITGLVNFLKDGDVTNDEIATAVRKRIIDIDFQNTTELNSTIYFCRVGHNDFNYSSNPTYTSNSKIVVKDKKSDSPVSYITTVGLYSADNEMLAVAKLSEPLRKDPTNDITLRVRLDY